MEADLWPSDFSKLDGASIDLVGYVEYGWDGWHIMCSIRRSKASESQLVLLADPKCFDAAKKHSHREGQAIVSGTYFHEDPEIFFHALLYSGQLKVSDIAWE
ncbi:MAG: hypothetical protein GKR90_06305 [Pseudomonadales bacterium]|nr:hypothetical protein [Pseudomonadales bacterium]